MGFELTLEEGKFLVKLARKAIEHYLKHREKINPPPHISAKLMEKCGVFVTLNLLRGREKELRGCIGYPEPIHPLAVATIDSAISAATNDPRFYPVSLSELDKIVIEVSVLTPPQLIKVENPKDYPKMIKIGVDGLIVERGFFRGLLLPQVPVEYGWNEEDFLAQCCMKAGLTPDAWLDRQTKIYKFQAIIFSEESPGGDVHRVELLKTC